MIPHRLPSPLTSFVGRQQEIAAVRGLLQNRRLVTLVGAPGVGKTRLALEVASGSRDRFEDGVWLVDLAPLDDASLLHQTVADTLGITAQPRRTLSETLVEALRSRRVLIVLDNCEHLIAGVASLVETLLRGCPRVQLLATSREPIAVVGEATWRVPSLTTPTDDALQSGGATGDTALAGFEAVRLFLDRARDADPSFALTADNGPAAARICARLDGIPLALELAASRLKVLSIDEIEARLADRFRLLTGGSRTALPRQQTLRGAVDWSYALLAEPERVLLRRLAVFAGSFTLETAETVCAGDGLDSTDVLGLLVSLVEKSLVQADDAEAGARRYRLLETFKQYGVERLAEAGERARLRGRHRDYFLALAEAIEPGLYRSGLRDARARLERVDDELRAALGWCIAEAAQGREHGDSQGAGRAAEAAEAGLRLAGALIRYWFIRSHQREARGWLEQLVTLPLPLDTPARRSARAKALHWLAMMIANEGEHRQSLPRLEEALALYRGLDDNAQIASVTGRLGQYLGVLGEHERARRFAEEGLARIGTVDDPRIRIDTVFSAGAAAYQRGDIGQATHLAEQAVAVCRQCGDDSFLTYSLRLLGRSLFAAGRRSEARSHLDEALQVSESLGNPRAVASSYKDLGDLAILDGDASRASALLRRGLATFVERGDRDGVLACMSGVIRARAIGAESDGCLARDATTADHLSDGACHACLRTASLLGAFEALSEAIGSMPSDFREGELDRARAAMKRFIGEAAFEEARSDGRAWSLEEAVAEVLGVDPSADTNDGDEVIAVPAPRATSTPSPLTRREEQIAVKISEGLTNRQIAAELGLSERTIDAHLRNIMSKLGVNSRAQVAAWIAAQGATPHR